MKDSSFILKIIAVLFFILGGMFLGLSVYLLVLNADGSALLESSSLGVLAALSAALGAAMLGGGFLLLHRRRALAAQMAWLQDNGVLLQGQVVSCEQEGNPSPKGKPTFVLKARYIDDNGKSYLFTRRGIEKNPLAGLANGQVTILCAKDDYSKFYMDLENTIAAAQWSAGSK